MLAVTNSFIIILHHNSGVNRQSDDFSWQKKGLPRSSPTIFEPKLDCPFAKCRSSIRHRPKNSISLRVTVVKLVLMNFESKFITVHLTLRNNHTNNNTIIPFALHFEALAEMLTVYENCVKFPIL